MTSRDKLNYVWNQERVPVILRRSGKGQRLRVRLPYAEGNRMWLQNRRRTNPIRNSAEKCWELPKAWFNDLVERALLRYGSVYVIQPYREHEICAPACQNAMGHECQCSCMGLYHGAENDGSWFEVSDTFAMRWGGLELACRLMTVREERAS
jgi:hypothetical protein